MRTLNFLRQISPMQILLLLVLTVALYFAAALAGELLASQHIDQQIVSLSTDIDHLRANNKRLTSQVAEARSEAYAEREARDRLGLVRPGDVPVVVVNAPAPAPTAAPPSPPARSHLQNWASVLGLQ